MNKIILSLFVFCLSASAFAQATYNSPESIEFDYANNRWLIANNSGNNILARNSATGALSVFAACSGGPHGIEIVNDTLYVCAGGNLKAFNINTASQIFNIALGATFLNGITHDNNGNLYLTDFTAKKIYRFNIYNRQFNLFATTTKTPNGIIYDQPNNRCVFVTWNASAAVMGINLSDSTVSQIVSTTLTSCDGIAKDGAGNYYISSWGTGSTTGAITRFTNAFTNPTTVVSLLKSPADIFYNVLTDTLGVPNSGASGGNGNKATFHYFGSATGINDEAVGTIRLSVNPNPVIKTAEISYEIINNSDVIIQLFDLKGDLVKTITNENQSKGNQTLFFSRSGLSAGIYMLTITTDRNRETKKIIIAE